MKIVVNGKTYDIEDSVTSLEGVISYIGINPKNTVCMINGEVVPLEKYPETNVTDGDALDVLAFVGGG